MEPETVAIKTKAAPFASRRAIDFTFPRSVESKAALIALCFDRSAKSGTIFP